MKAAKSIKEFCADYGISQATFYRHRNEMPAVTTIGRQNRILMESEAEWKARHRRGEEAA